MPSWPSKYAAEDKTYGVDWTPQLGTLTISTSTFVTAVGTATHHGDNLTGAFTHTLIQGGAPGESCEFTNTITLSDGQIWVEPCYLQIFPE